MANRVNNFETIANKFIEQIDDKSWVDFILTYLIEFYNRQDDKTSFIDKSENQITEIIYSWLNNEKNFRRKMVINSQPRTDNTEIEGYYDLKFQSNFWRENDIYFAVENKILQNNNTSIKEYTYYPEKSKGTGENKKYYDDGGMFRFLSNKYAENQPFGGMLAFIKDKDVSKINTNLKNKISELKISDNIGFYGQLINDNSINTTIHNFDNSFITKHIRKDGTSIDLYHIFFVFG